MNFSATWPSVQPVARNILDKRLEYSARRPGERQEEGNKTRQLIYAGGQARGDSTSEEIGGGSVSPSSYSLVAVRTERFPTIYYSRDYGKRDDYPKHPLTQQRILIVKKEANSWLKNWRANLKRLCETLYLFRLTHYDTPSSTTHYYTRLATSHTHARTLPYTPRKKTVETTMSHN